MPWQEDVSQKVLVSNPGAGKGFLCCNISVEVYFYSYLVVSFVHQISVS